MGDAARGGRHAHLAADGQRCPGVVADYQAAPDRFDVRAIVQKAIGPGIAFETSWVTPWARQSLLARRFRQGRCFLAGDAAHLLSPTGGFGMNTGIQEAVDLGWKLAAVEQAGRLRPCWTATRPSAGPWPP